MKVYRGPRSKDFFDDAHELVARINPKELEAGVKSKARIRFNITKDAVERQAVCTAEFEDADLIPMISGLLSRLTAQQECLATVKALLADKTTSVDQKLTSIRAALGGV